MEPTTVECSASVWPHRHTDEMSGPLDVKISVRNQPSIVAKWPKGKPVWISLVQPDVHTNLTIIKLGFNWLDDENVQTRINQCRISRDNSLKFYIKTRLINKVTHPIPRGKWPGMCQYTDKWCVFTLQAMTMKVKPDEPRILLPDGTLPASKKVRLVMP